MENEMQKCVLVVDDDEMMLTVIVKLLEVLRYETVSVSGGEEALECMDARHFDIVCTDLQMKGMNGDELIRHVRERSPETAIVLMTGLDEDKYSRNGGADVYLHKPFTVFELRESLRSAFQNRRGGTAGAS